MRPRCDEAALALIRDLTEAVSPALGSKDALEAFVLEMCDACIRHPWLRGEMESGACPVSVDGEGHVSLADDGRPPGPDCP